MNQKITARFLEKELQYTTSRSSGPGGQNVNKVETKVTLKLDLENSALLNPDEKDLLKEKLKSFLTKDGVLVLTSQESRSQLQNREDVFVKLDALLAKAFEKRKKRKPTKPSKSAVQKRITGKKKTSEKKQWRQRLD